MQPGVLSFDKRTEQLCLGEGWQGSEFLSRRGVIQRSVLDKEGKTLYYPFTMRGYFVNLMCLDKIKRERKRFCETSCHSDGLLRQHPIIRAVLGTIAALFVTLILVGGALLVVMKGRDLQVPRPVQERLIQQLNASISGVTLSFDDVTIGLSENWQPTLNLQRVALSQGDKPSFLQLNTVQAQVSLDDALRGSLRVSEVSMEGAKVAIQRDLWRASNA